MQQSPQGQEPYPTYAQPTPQQAPVQWTQMGVPGQTPYTYQAPMQNQGVRMPGQLPPPAQLDIPAPLPQQIPGYMPGPQAPELDTDTPQDTQNPQQTSRKKGGYQAPATGMPRTFEKKSKHLKLYLLGGMILLGFLAFALFRVFSPMQAGYAYVQRGSLSARYSGDAVIVRSEAVYQHNGTSQIDYRAEEGAFVERGTPIAVAYTSGYSAKEMKSLNEYRNRIRNYHKILVEKASDDASLREIMKAVTDRAVEAQQLIQGAQGSLIQQEALLSTAMSNLRIYIKQKFPDDQKLSRYYDDEEAQLNRISTWSKQYAAQVNGLVSFYTDGFENSLNMITYEDYSPVQVRAFYQGKIPETKTTYSRTSTVSIYRLVRQEPWVVLMLCNEKDWAPVTGRTYKLLIESFDNTVVDATVESFTRSGGELLIRLRVDNTAALSNVLYIRSCQVQLGETVNTLLVPSRAIYIREGRKGVVINAMGGEYWTGVEVISDDGTEAYIIPENSGVLYDGVRLRLF